MSEAEQDRKATVTGEGEEPVRSDTAREGASTHADAATTDADAVSTDVDEGASTDAATSDVAVESPQPRKKRKKRRSEERQRGELDAAGMQRPAFVLDFPTDPELDVLVRAFEAGNFAFVRAQAPRLAESSPSAEVKAAARELLRRIEPDPLVKFLLGVAVLLFLVVVSYVYYSHGR